MTETRLFRRLLTALCAAILVAAAAATAAAPPVALDDTYFTLIDDNLSVDAPGVLGNDSDPDDDPLTAVLIDSSQAEGVLLLAPDGSFEYEPAPGFAGSDVFTYVADDGSAVSNPATVTFHVTGTPGVTTYTDETAFRTALAAAGYTAFFEGFEDEAVWGDVRTTIVGGDQTAPSVFNLGITWTANNTDSEVTTGEGPALHGQWGFFTLPHGSYGTGTDCDQPINCGDGWIGTGDGQLVAVGGWVETNTPYAGIKMYLDGNMNAPIDFGVSLGTQYQFIGVIVPAGFGQFEFRETEGVITELKYIFGDDMTFAFASDLFVRVQRIQMARVAGGSQVGARVTLADHGGAPVAGAVVSAEFTYPDGTGVPVSGVSNGRGRVQWLVPVSDSGAYTLTVQSVSKPGYVFLGGTMTRTITVP